MLTALSIRDVVLIERLDLGFGPGLTVLTGETGAGKSILLDSLGLALGARAEAGLVRAGAEQASVTACFAPPAGHPIAALLAEQGLEAEDEIVLRRVLGRDGRSRAFLNDQPVGVALLRRAGALLVEVQGQHEQMGLADPASHGTLLDAFGVAPALRQAVLASWRDWRGGAGGAGGRARARSRRPQRDEEWLRHAVDELAPLAPPEDEEDRLAAERQRLQQGERRAEAIAAALAELTPGPWARPARPGPGGGVARGRAGVAAAGRSRATRGRRIRRRRRLAALERAEEALAEAETLLTRLAAEADADPRLLEQAEERLFALRAAARKHAVTVAELPGLLDTLAARLAALETGAAEVAALEQAAAAARARLCRGCRGADRGAPGRRAAAGSRGGEGTAAAAAGQGAVPCRGDGAGGGGMGRARRRPGALPDRHQSRAGAGAAGADRLGRRTVAADAGAEGGAARRLGRRRRWCSTRWTAASAARRRRRWASGWRAWRRGCRCWW